jgi:hypothetical protein
MSSNSCRNLQLNSCSIWDLTQQLETNELIELYQQQQLSIAGAIVNVFKLLGLKEQRKLTDLTGNGKPISSGYLNNNIPDNAFNILNVAWESKQSGANVINSGYIGYDFGQLKLPNGRDRYGIDTEIIHNISCIRIKQGPTNCRVTKARVERSSDGINWYGVSIVRFPDNSNLNEVSFKLTVPSRYWRIKPLEFTGMECDSWIIHALELLESSGSDRKNIEDVVLLENRNRNYSTTYLSLKGYYDTQQPIMDFSRFGGELPQLTYNIKLNFNSCVSMLGRPPVIGDVIELPSEVQYSPDLTPIKKYLEVTDVAWDSMSFTPGWQPTMLLLTAAPLLASQETQDIFGDLSISTDNSGLFNNNNKQWQDLSEISQSIAHLATQQVPERGNDAKNVIREIDEDTLQEANKVGLKQSVEKMNIHPTDLYVESAMPPNGQEYSEGTSFPDKPNNGDYHRMTYVGRAGDIPARLYRWSTIKNRWIYLETDRRMQFNSPKETIDEYLSSTTKQFARDIK